MKEKINELLNEYKETEKCLNLGLDWDREMILLRQSLIWLELSLVIWKGWLGEFKEKWQMSQGICFSFFID